MKIYVALVVIALGGIFAPIAACFADDGSVLPFPATPSASVAKPRLQDSVHKRRVEPSRVAADAPNILIVLVDDAGFGVPDTFGGFAHTPTLTKLSNQGLSYNRFHTTSICSPTRASLLTGRNHQRVGSGTIAERAVDWDGYTGVIPKSSATIAETLRHYGYKTSAFGKWHNTPADQTTALGPFEYWPTGYGFDYFYGFLAGETSQWEPRLVENTTAIEPPHNEKYHLTEDMVDKSITWLKRHRAFAPDKPFFMYWAPGGVHGPHHVAKDWSAKYKSKFDQGWDRLREETFARQKKLGWIPADTKLTPRHPTMPAWDSIPESERAFQSRLMEIFAGFCEHTDAQVGKLIDSLDEMGLRENTLIFYIWGDNGSSAEGQNGSISELLAQNQIPSTIDQQIKTLAELGGLDALGTSVTDNIYHAGWAWAGSTPFQNTKLIASHFGGTRNPLVVSWPKKIKADKSPRSQFQHVNDVAPTIYELLNIKHPNLVNGFEQDPIDGVSMAKSFFAADTKGSKPTQYFDNNGSRGIYHDGWYACTFGPLIPWLNAQKGLADWDSAKDEWELYDLRNDFSQANNLATNHPEQLAELKKLFLAEAEKNKVFPIGAGIRASAH
jgi:arylsulfatase A-like enzyme